MDTKNKSEMLALREEYEQSGLTVSFFAKRKGVEYWKMNYALRKGLEFKDKNVSSKVGFKKIVAKTIVDPKKEIRIKTTYGAEIIIPL